MLVISSIYKNVSFPVFESVKQRISPRFCMLQLMRLQRRILQEFMSGQHNTTTAHNNTTAGIFKYIYISTSRITYFFGMKTICILYNWKHNIKRLNTKRRENSEMW